MIGSRARWTVHVEGQDHTESGVIVAVQKVAGIQAWSILAMNDAGELRMPIMERLTILVGDETAARRAGEEAIAQIEYLDGFLAAQFSDVDLEGTAVERATQLLGELRRELLETAAARDAERARADKARADKLEAAAAKKGGKADKNKTETAEIKGPTP